MKFLCKTFFDITATGVTGHFKASRVPFTDSSGNIITDEASWNRARNRQRNLETITQLISLRTHINEMTNPKRIEELYTFEFEIETPYAFGPEENPTESLLSDSAGVPMLLGLDNVDDLSPMIVVSGHNQNIWFNKI